MRASEVERERERERERAKERRSRERERERESGEGGPRKAASSPPTRIAVANRGRGAAAPTSRRLSKGPARAPSVAISESSRSDGLSGRLPSPHRQTGGRDVPHTPCPRPPPGTRPRRDSGPRMRSVELLRAVRDRSVGPARAAHGVRLPRRPRRCVLRLSISPSRLTRVCRCLESVDCVLSVSIGPTWGRFIRPGSGREGGSPVDWRARVCARVCACVPVRAWKGADRGRSARRRGTRPRTRPRPRSGGSLCVCVCVFAYVCVCVCVCVRACVRVCARARVGAVVCGRTRACRRAGIRAWRAQYFTSLGRPRLVTRNSRARAGPRSGALSAITTTSRTGGPGCRPGMLGWSGPSNHGALPNGRTFP